MSDAGPMASQLAPLLIGLAVIVPIVLRRNARARKLKIELMWLRPAIFVALALSLLISAPPPLTVVNLAAMAAGLLLGAALGWQRGQLIRIEVDPETHEINQRASPAALFFLAVLIVLRFGVRDLTTQGVSGAHISIALVTDTLVLFAAGMVVTQMTEMWLRARRLLAAARAVKVAG